VQTESKLFKYFNENS